MSLFRRFFNRKPPDRLLEISERVYVFDCCFSTDVLEEDEYKVYMGDIVAKLQDYYPDSSFMVFNFREGDKRTQISDMLSQYDMTVMEYPRSYEGCPVISLEMIHHFLKCSESWLSLAGQQNVLLLHCERGGWPVLAFMLAALILFRKQYNGEQKTLEMVYKQAPRELLRLLTPLNPQPSQLRYLQYISTGNLDSNRPPSDTPLALDYIRLKFLPLFGEKGCRPVIRIYGQDLFSTTANRNSKLLFTSKKQARYYQPEECRLVKIDIHHLVQGDVVLECVHMDHVREEMIFRVMFHTTFLRSNVLILSRDEVDVMWDARDLMPKYFKAEVCFSDADALLSMITTEEELQDENGTGGPIHEEVFEVEEIFNNVFDGQDGLLPKEEKFEDENGTRSPTHEEFIEVVEISSNVVYGQDGLPKVIDVDAENGDILLKEETEPEAQNGDIAPPPSPVYATPFRRRRAPFLKDFEHLKIPLAKIKSATDNFHKNRFIGKGGFGEVYRGEVSHHKGKSGAFKRLNPMYGQGNTEFWKEILMLSSYKHENLINLLGFCDEGGEKILVYEYASNGSLDRHLNSIHLTWRQRIQICLDAARGMMYLHDDKGKLQRVIHRDIKSSNILLDENWRAKVSDMGLSKIGPANQQYTFLITQTVGTYGYCDPEYYASNTLSKESDIYSFGVVLFEVLCGRLCYSFSDGKSILLVNRWKKAYREKKLHEIVFQDLMQPMDSTSLEIFSGIAFHCLHVYREERPTIAHVVKKLETALEFELQKPSNKYEVALEDASQNYKSTKVTGRVLQGSLWEELQRPGQPQSALDFDASELETLFPAIFPKKDTSEGGGSKPEKVHMIDLRRANATEIMLTKVKMPLPNMMAAALAMDESILDADQIENLIKFCPTKEEIELLNNYTGDKEMLGKCEQFFLELMMVPRVELKLWAFLFKIRFNIQISEFKKSLNTVNIACDEVRNSVKLKETIRRILYLENAFNQGTDRGSAGFKLDKLFKLTDTQTSNGKMTLMHYLCKVLASKSPALLDIHVDLVSLESATKIQIKSLAEEMQAINKGLEKVKQELVASANDGPASEVFHKTLKEFIDFAEPEVASVDNLYDVVGRNADALVRYFGEDPARCPFEHVTRTLFDFVRLFRKAHEENCRQAELENIESSKRG